MHNFAGRGVVAAAWLAAALIAAAPARAEDGYDLWLRYRPIADATRLADIRARATMIVAPTEGETMRVAVDELRARAARTHGRDVARADLPTAPAPSSSARHRHRRQSRR